MTFRELIGHIATHGKPGFLDGDLETTVEKSRSGNHPDPLAGQIIAALYEKCALTGLDTPVERANAIGALGPLRLAFMRDDAPVEGFRMMEDVVYLIDSAYNDEAQRLGEN